MGKKADAPAPSPAASAAVAKKGAASSATPSSPPAGKQGAAASSPSPAAAAKRPSLPSPPGSPPAAAVRKESSSPPPGSPPAAAAAAGKKQLSSPPASPAAAGESGKKESSSLPGSAAAAGAAGKKELSSPPGSGSGGGGAGKKGSVVGGGAKVEESAGGGRKSLSREPAPNAETAVLPVPSGVADAVHPEDAEFRERAATATIADERSAMSTLSFMAAGALAEIHRVFNRCDMMRNDPAKVLVRQIMLARGNIIVLHGVGREGLMMRGLTMRLFHLGLRAHCLGDMTTPKLGPGDLFIASAGPGEFSSVNALMTTAKEAGATVLLVTAQSEGTAAKIAHFVAWLPAQTMKDEDPEAGQLPQDRPFDRYSIPARPAENLYAFHRSFKPTDIFDDPLPLSSPGMLDKKTKEDAKSAIAAKLKDDIRKGQGPKDYSKLNQKPPHEEDDSAADDPKSPKSPKSGKSGQSGKKEERRGELGVGGIPGKERVPHYMLPLEGGHIEREIVQKCRGDPEYICLLAENKILPMGSVYEGSLYILFEIVVYTLRVKLHETLEGMVSRHTNME